MSLELLAGILVWGGVGWLLDDWLGTEPWLLGVGVLGGFAAGLYLVWLRTNERPTKEPGRDDPVTGMTTDGLTRRADHR